MAESTHPIRTPPRGHVDDDELHVAEDDRTAETHRDEDAVTYAPQAYTGVVRDRVRWGSVWAGLIAALTVFLILITGAIAIGIQALSPTSGTGTDAGMTSAIVTAAIALIAFFIGGYIAGWTLGGIGRGAGALNGFLVWGLGVGILLILTAFGLGSLFGAAGELFAQFQQFQSFQAQGVDASALITTIQNTAVRAFAGILLPAVFAAFGGFVGAMNTPAPEHLEA